MYRVSSQIFGAQGKSIMHTHTQIDAHLKGDYCAAGYCGVGRKGMTWTCRNSSVLEWHGVCFFVQIQVTGPPGGAFRALRLSCS